MKRTDYYRIQKARRCQFHHLARPRYPLYHRYMSRRKLSFQLPVLLCALFFTEAQQRVRRLEFYARPSSSMRGAGARYQDEPIVEPVVPALGVPATKVNWTSSLADNWTFSLAATNVGLWAHA